MSRKDYEALARAINAQRQFGSEQEREANLTIHRVAHSIARTLQSENSRFDYSRFINACGF